jgi:hypothetical protein
MEPLGGGAYTPVTKGYLDLVQFLVLSGADVNARDSQGATPLHASATIGTLDVARFLVERGADTRAKDKAGKIPLDYAELGMTQQSRDVAMFLRSVEPRAKPAEGRLVLPRVATAAGDGSNVKVTLRLGTEATAKREGTGLFSAFGSVVARDPNGRIVACGATAQEVIDGVPVSTLRGDFFVRSDLTLVGDFRWDGNKQGATHTILGSITLFDYAFESSREDPLVFLLTEEGYQYKQGTGKVLDTSTGVTTQLPPPVTPLPEPSQLTAAPTGGRSTVGPAKSAETKPRAATPAKTASPRGTQVFRPDIVVPDYLLLSVWAMTRSGAAALAKGGFGKVEVYSAYSTSSDRPSVNDRLEKAAMPLLKKHGLMGAKPKKLIGYGEDSPAVIDWQAKLVLPSFGRNWVDPLSVVLGRHGNLPAVSFRNGRAVARLVSGRYQMSVTPGTEIQVSGVTWAFQKGKWRRTG